MYFTRVERFFRLTDNRNGLNMLVFTILLNRLIGRMFAINRRFYTSSISHHFDGHYNTSLFSIIRYYNQIHEKKKLSFNPIIRTLNSN